MAYYSLLNIPDLNNLSAIIGDTKRALQDGAIGVSFSELSGSQEGSFTTLTIAFMLEIKRAFPQVRFHELPQSVHNLLALYSLQDAFLEG